ncbi:MAG: alcohol dehydrogenase catalytic domain-containing protein [candidate division Zixibacteria bacterium]
MLQAVITAPATFDIIDVPVPEVGNEQVLIKVARIGICGSDMQIYHGKHKFMTFPVVLGHEGSGTIVKIGTAVLGFAVGDRVTVQPQYYCGECFPCREGKYNVCEHLSVIGVHETGMGEEYFLTDASKVLKLPDRVSFDQGALIEPTAVATGAIRKSGGVNSANIVVLGAGPIGNLVAQVAKASGAKSVMITDINPKRLDVAGRCRVDYCVNSTEWKLNDAIVEYFGSDGADIIFDCAGVKETVTDAIQAARRGSRIVVVANFKTIVDIELVLLQRKEITLYGIMMYVREDYEEAIRLLAERRINTSELITSHFDIRQIREAYKYIDENINDVIKVILTVSD